MPALTKKHKFFLAILALILLMGATVPAAVWVTHQSGSKLGNARARCERGDHASHQVRIRADKASPAHIDAKLCDKLTITNRDDRDRLMAFGQHDNHISYDGVSERVLGKGQSLTVTLVK